jgi:hypothetical protein
MAFRAGGADFAGVKTKKRARERAHCVRQNWGHRAKSHFLPLLIRFGPAKPHQTEGTCLHQASQVALRGPKEKDRERWQATCEGRFRAAKPPPTHHGDGEALQCPGFSGRRYASVLCTIFLA